MFQVRSMADIITCRCVEVEPYASYLSTEFSYIVIFHNNSIVYVWIGNNCTGNDSQHAKVYGKRFSKEYNYNLKIINESSLDFPDEFWIALNGKSDYIQTTFLRNSARLFRCTNDQGFYAIRERYADFCQVFFKSFFLLFKVDLLFDDVMMLDSGETVCLLLYFYILRSLFGLVIVVAILKVI